MFFYHNSDFFFPFGLISRFYAKNSRKKIVSSENSVSPRVLDIHSDRSSDSLLEAFDSYSFNFKDRRQNDIIDTTLVSNVGTVFSVGDGVVRTRDLMNVFFGEKVLFHSLSSGIVGMVSNIENTVVSIVVFGSENSISEGDIIIRTGTTIQTRVGRSVLGSIVDPFGNVIWNSLYSNLDYYKYDILFRNIEIKAPGILSRKRINSSLHTGLKVVDCMIPIGKGQRELIIGDRQTGKSTIAITAILNQKRYHAGFYADSSVNYSWRSQVYCVYVAIGQKRSSIKRLYNLLKRENALDFTCIVSATASEPAALQYIAPYSGCTIGEWFRDNGMHSLVIYDDLTKHATSYRQISLLLRRPPGREAYPGDVFYIHSRLLERAAQMSFSCGGGSLTALPIVETQEGDVSAYIPTNVISITDGQICLDKELFNKGIRPAINVGLSVSRVGSAAQNISMKQIAGQLKLFLAQYRSLEGVEKFSTDLDPTIASIILRGSRLVELLKQKRPMSLYQQVISIFAGLNGFFDSVNLDSVRFYEAMLFQDDFITLVFNRFIVPNKYYHFYFSKVFFFHRQYDFNFYFQIFGSKSYFTQLSLWLNYTTTYFVSYMQDVTTRMDRSKFQKLSTHYIF
jgi:F-type H+-transporting ATPase subunit alpha